MKMKEKTKRRGLLWAIVLGLAVCGAVLAITSGSGGVDDGEHAAGPLWSAAWLPTGPLVLLVGMIGLSLLRKARRAAMVDPALGDPAIDAE